MRREPICHNIEAKSETWANLAQYWAGLPHFASTWPALPCPARHWCSVLSHILLCFDLLFLPSPASRLQWKQPLALFFKSPQFYLIAANTTEAMCSLPLNTFLIILILDSDLSMSNFVHTETGQASYWQIADIFQFSFTQFSSDERSARPSQLSSFAAAQRLFTGHSLWFLGEPPPDKGTCFQILSEWGPHYGENFFLSCTDSLKHSRRRQFRLFVAAIPRHDVALVDFWGLPASTGWLLAGGKKN